MTYKSTKKYGHNLGLSCCFRQWKADSSCKLLHGYALAFKLEFESSNLDHRNWCVNFGGLKDIKKFLEDKFDHTLLVASDDPKKDIILDLDRIHGIANVIEIDKTGCEAIAKLVFEFTKTWLEKMNYSHDVKLLSVEVSEHEANSAIYSKE